MQKAKKKQIKKKKYVIGPREFLFDFISLVLVLGVGIYFGYRCFYYYSKQNMKRVADLQTLNGVILQNNKIVFEGDGLYQDTDGYFFHGNVSNNYVLIGNILFRIVQVSKDNSVRLVSEAYIASFPWGEEANYQTSNVRLWLEKSEIEHSGIFYSLIPDISLYFNKTKYHEDTLKDNKVINGTEEYNDYVSILTISDYIRANGKNSYLNTGNLFYLLGYSENNENLYVEEDGTVHTCDSLSGFGIRPVLTLKGDSQLTSGDGTVENPYRLSFDGSSFVGKYVKLGNDVWRIYTQEGDTLRLHLNGYLQENGNSVVRAYSQSNSIFSITDKKHLGYYLNTTYYNQLSYGTILLDCPSYIGEISDDQGYQYTNIYNDVIVSKVTLLNIFDPIVSPELNNYFYLNTTSLVGSMEYDRFSSGVLEESDVRDEKPIVPAVCISNSIIKSGQGTILDPYVVE